METNRNNGPKGIGLKDAEGNVIGHPLNRQDSKSLVPTRTTGI